MADLIDRVAVLEICTRFPYPEGIANAVAALPAQGVDVVKLRQIANNLSCLDARSRGASEAILAAIREGRNG